MREIIVVYMKMKKPNYPIFLRLILLLKDQTCLPNSGKKHVYIMFNTSYFSKQPIRAELLIIIHDHSK